MTALNRSSKKSLIKTRNANQPSIKRRRENKKMSASHLLPSKTVARAEMEYFALHRQYCPTPNQILTLCERERDSWKLTQLFYVFFWGGRGERGGEGERGVAKIFRNLFPETKTSLPILAAENGAGWGPPSPSTKIKTNAHAPPPHQKTFRNGSDLLIRIRGHRKAASKKSKKSRAKLPPLESKTQIYFISPQPICQIGVCTHRIGDKCRGRIAMRGPRIPSPGFPIRP